MNSRSSHRPPILIDSLLAEGYSLQELVGQASTRPADLARRLGQQWPWQPAPTLAPVSG